MKFNRIFIPAAVALVAGTTFSSCSDDDVYYTTGDPSSSAPVVEDFNLSKTFNWELVDADDEDSGYHFSPEIPTPTFTPTLRRAEGSTAVTVRLNGYSSITDDGEMTPYDPTIWEFPSVVTMEAGQTELEIPVTLLTREIGSYTLYLYVENSDVLNMDSNTEWIITANLTSGINWVKLDKGTYKDTFFYDGSDEYPYPECDIYYDASSEYGKGKPGHYGHYLIANPYQWDINNNAAFDVDDPTTYIEFYVMGPGETLPYTTVEVPSGSYYVSAISHDTGVYNTYYGDEIYALYSGYWYGTSATIDSFKSQVPLVWKDGKTPNESMMAEGGVYDPFSEDYISEGVYPVGNPGAFSLGCYYYMFNVGGWNYTQTTKQIQYIFDGVTVGDYGINLSYNGHIISEDKKTEWIEAAVEFTGKETAFAYVGLVATSDADYALEVLENSIIAAESEDTGEEPDPSLPVVAVEKLMKPDEDNGIELARFVADGSGSYTLAAISYSSESSTNNKGQVTYTYTAEESVTYTLKFTSINDMGGDSDWESIGVGEYHDDILTDIFDGLSDYSDYLTYEVEVQRNINEPSRYRIVNPYGSGVYPFTFSSLTTVDEYMEFDTTYPNAVMIPDYALGKASGYAINVCSLSYYYYSRGILSIDEIVADGIGGNFELGVITFPAESILLQFEYWSSGWYYTNENGTAELVIPEGGYTVNRTRKSVKSQPMGNVRLKGASKAKKFTSPFKAKSTPFSGKPGIKRNLPLQQANVQFNPNWRVPMTR